ncbi:MAG: PD40 domain-containing protein, partial [Deltaproteobacteria bacterium]|nr:PD40 domain-containing protein [Deltaproteobacteria bacterium]
GSPDGKSIAFVSDRDGSPQIYIISVEGGAIKRISMAGSYNTAPDWSPDGAEISFSGRIAGERSAIFKVKLDTLEMIQLTSGVFTDEEPSYSPDGKLIAFTSNMSGKKQIYVMTSEGKNVKQITYDDNEYFTPCWEKFFAGM